MNATLVDLNTPKQRILRYPVFAPNNSL